MPAHIKRLGRTIVIRMEGELKLGAAVEEFRACWSDALATGTQHIILDLKEVPAIDSSGIGALVRCHTAVRGNGGKMEIVGAGEAVHQAFRLTQLDRVFSFHSDERSAMGAIEPAV